MSVEKDVLVERTIAVCRTESEMLAQVAHAWFERPNLAPGDIAIRVGLHPTEVRRYLSRVRVLGRRVARETYLGRRASGDTRCSNQTLN